MKKLLLTLAISIIGFIGFSSAVDVSCNYDSAGGGINLKGGGQKRGGEAGDNSFSCDPSGIDSIYLNDFTISFDFDLQGFIGVIEDNLTIYLTDGGKNQIPILYCDYIDEECYNYDITVNTYEDINTSYNGNSLEYKIEYQGFGNFDFDFSYSITDNEENEPDEPDEPGTGGNENLPVIPDNPGEGGNGGNIVPDGSIVAVISGVFSVFAELIPYIVYLGIGILIVTVGFYAIRWLVNWVSNKINNNFKF